MLKHFQDEYWKIFTEDCSDTFVKLLATFWCPNFRQIQTSNHQKICQNSVFLIFIFPKQPLPLFVLQLELTNFQTKILSSVYFTFPLSWQPQRKCWKFVGNKIKTQNWPWENAKSRKKLVEKQLLKKSKSQFVEDKRKNWITIYKNFINNFRRRKKRKRKERKKCKFEEKI